MGPTETPDIESGSGMILTAPLNPLDYTVSQKTIVRKLLRMTVVCLNNASHFIVLKGGPILSRAALLPVFRIKCVPNDVILFMGAQERTHVSDYLADNATCFCWHHVGSTWVIHE
ncbi:hypothetical protein E1301_Tti011681 [Triplophysa tibetana]|uniref:Uncharacterized protein n=1 Tax=Triplophysa tibetana TaxID=1572043 RepID=A0A5A9PDK3_9TELE|nr:hypothetical protein E1301_Tti011681 [Triplophysa tibetana]